MRWLPFIILAIVMLVLQGTIVQKIAIRGVWPDWMFILAVYYALWGRWPDAAIAAWILGLLVDLQSRGWIGLNAFCFGGAAWAILYIRQALFRDHPITQVVVTLVFALGVRLAVGGYDAWRAGGGIPVGEIGSLAFFTALYTAACAPYVHWALIRVSGWTGLKQAAGHRR